MEKIVNIIFPKSADNNYKGSRLAAFVFLFISTVGIVRSFIHFLAPDGGAGSIAGMDLSVQGAEGIIFAFSLWGSAQLLYALIQLVVYFRYKTLIPFMYILIILETLMRMLIGKIKPVQFAHTPPGGLANYIILPVAVVMLYLAIRRDGGKISGKKI